MNATNSRSKRGKLTTQSEEVQDLFGHVTLQGDDYEFTITLKNNLRMIKGGYATEATAEQAGKLTAKYYGVDITPVKKQAKREGMK